MPRSRSTAPLVVLLLAALAACSGVGGSDEQPRQPEGLRTVAAQVDQPNIVLITSDDQTLREMRWLPRTRKLLGRRGVTFRDMVAAHPNCCPARAQILTGQYAHNNGVRTNGPPHGGHQGFTAETALPVWLQEAGYATGFTGKYMHGYDESLPVEPGWDHFRPIVTQPLSAYYGILEHDDGTPRQLPDDVYHTHHVADRSVEMVQEFAAADRPFFVWSSYIAPHGSCATSEAKDCSGPPEVEPKYADRFGGVRLPSLDSPSFNEQDMSDKPRKMRRLPKVSAREQQRRFTARLQSLASLDDAVVRTVRALRRAGVLDDTVIMFTSDNGYLFGEHRLEGKNVAYEESVRVPLLVRGPGVPAGEQRDQSVAMIDLAPTVAELAGATPQVVMDGISVWGYATRDVRQGDRVVLLQAGSRDPDPAKAWKYRAVRTGRYTYVDYQRWRPDELYDRRRDPYQLRSVVRDPAYRAVRQTLRRQLTRVQDCSGTSCRLGVRP